MKLRLLVGLMSMTCATSADAAETWICSYSTQSGPGFYRFELSSPDLIQTEPPFLISRDRERYRNLQNNDYGLVATLSLSEIEVPGGKPTVVGWTVAINKETGEFVFKTAMVGTISGDVPNVDQSVQGKCIKS
jgi:hypothetical protein